MGRDLRYCSSSRSASLRACPVRLCSGQALSLSNGAGFVVNKNPCPSALSAVLNSSFVSWRLSFVPRYWIFVFIRNAIFHLLVSRASFFLTAKHAKGLAGEYLTLPFSRHLASFVVQYFRCSQGLRSVNLWFHVSIAFQDLCYILAKEAFWHHPKGCGSSWRPDMRKKRKELISSILCCLHLPPYKRHIYRRRRSFWDALARLIE